MRKIPTFLVLFFLALSQFQVLPLYAQSVAELAAEKEQSVEILQAVDTAIDATVEKLDAKISSSQSKEKLQEKHEEISEYLEEVKQDIQNENNVEDIEEKVEEAKKVAVLKVVAGVTPTEDLENTIDETIATTTAEKEEILELAKDSLETQAGDYSIIVKTSYDEAKVKSRFKTFDETSQVTALYSVGAINYFEVFIREDSIFRQEMLEDIDAGILPENFLGIEIVLPEVFSVFTTDLTGENISQTWGIERYQTYNHLDEIQKHNTQQIKVGVVDTGVDYTHPDLQNTTNTNLDKDFVNEDNDAMDDQGHGTHVAGTIAATINGNGIIGVNPNAEIIPLKICTSSGFCPSYAVIRALEYAAEKDVDILNMSLGGRGNPADHAICAAIDAYTQNGGLVVAAAGNANIAANEFVPGGCSSSLAVAAIDETNRRASFSNYGSKVDVAAPGVNVYSTYPTNKGNYKQLSGTSMAAPHIAGLVSLMFEAEGNMTLSEVKNKLQSYPQEVTTDATHKTIAKAVDVNALLASYTNEDNTETNTPEEQNEEIEIQEESTETENNETESNEEEQAAEEQSEEDNEQEEASSFKKPLIDFGDVAEILGVNSGDIQTEIIDIDEQEEELKQFMPAEGEKVYNEDGEKIENPTEISSDEVFVPATRVEGEGIDGSQIPDSEFPQTQEDLEINEIPEVKKFFIDGAQEYIGTNSNTEPVPLDITIEGENEESSATGRVIDVFPVVPEQEVVDESGEEFTGFTQVFPLQEENIYREITEEIFIDGAQKGVEINSNEEVVGKEIIVEEYNEEDLFDDQYMGEIPDPTTGSGETIGIQNVKTCNTFVGRQCIYRVGSIYQFLIETDVEGIAVEKRTSSRYFRLEGVAPGTTTYRLYYNNRLSFSVNVTVQAAPIPEEHDVVVEQGKSVKIYIPEDSYYSVTQDGNNSGNARLTEYPGYVELFGEDLGEITYHLRGNYSFPRHILNVKVIEEQPQLVEFSGYVGDLIYYNRSGADRYQLTIDSEIGNNFELYRNHYNLRFKALQAGKIEVLMVWGQAKFLVRFTIYDKPTEYRYDIEKGRTMTRLLSEDNYIIHDEGRTGGLDMSFVDGTSEISFTGTEVGNHNYIIRDERGAPKYVFLVTVRESYTIYEGERLQIRYQLGHLVTRSLTPGIIDVEPSAYYTYIVGLKGGKALVDVKTHRGVPYERYYVNVIPAPVPVVYDFDLTIRDRAEVTLPEDVSLYTFSMTDDGPFSDHDGDSTFTIENDRTFKFEIYRAGESVISLKDSHGFPIYIVNVTSDVIRGEATLILGEERDPGLSASDRHYSDDPSIAWVSRGYDEVQAVGIGETNIHSHDDDSNIRERTTHITVVPVPDPTEINCTIYPGETCRFEATHGGVSYTTSNSSAFEIEYGSKTIRAKGLSTGTATVYAKSRYSDRITHIMNVTVIPRPPQEFDCTTPVGLECQTKWYDDEGIYTVTSSDTSIVNVSLERYFLNPEDTTSKKMERIKITGVSEGTADVYIYKRGDHTATVHMTITPAIPPFHVSDHSVTIDQGESVRIPITSGGGNYTEDQDYDKTIVYADADTNADNLTGKVDITGKEPGYTEVTFLDQYYQEQTVRVTVEDAILELDREELTVSGSNYEYIVANKAHTGIKSVETDNDHASAQVVTLLNGERVVKVSANSAGVTTVTVYDYEGLEGNKDTVVVTVGSGSGGGGNELEDPEKDDIDNTVDRIDTISDLEDFFDFLATENIHINPPADNGDLEVNNVLLDIFATYDEYKFNNSWDDLATDLADYFVHHGKYTEADRLKLEESVKLMKERIDNKLSSISNVDILISRQEIMYQNVSNKIKNISIRQTPYNTYQRRIREHNMYSAIRNTIYYSYEKVINEYYQANKDEFTEKQNQYISEVADVIGVKNAGEGLGAMGAYWTGVITNDQNLTDAAKADLYIALDGLKGDLNPIVRVKRLKKISKLIKGAEKAGSDWYTLTGVTWSKVPKPDLDSIQNDKLKTIIEQCYRNESVVGNKSTADALRYERKKGILLSDTGHEKKVVDRRREIKSWLKTYANEFNPRATPYEVKVANDILDDLNKAFDARY